ncbi:hypothetical protein FOZ63_024316 [Perkinsus olseni]|uniref:Uncharacterized protein n=1 Tax=Perkinsus olseni TaxID=32597 RepID=A0A7J6SCN9_PEROL|nr:hypothetical protein FOZ62_029680 [Perkinsus olseni]KAF4749435.1 hypothetical protein FOZ63_024316 [Perkinsus olseni]
MKIFLTVAVTLINAILWEGCGSNNNNGASSTTTAAPTAPPPPVPPVTTPSSGPTQAPGPAPSGTFVYDGPVLGLGNVTSSITVSNADPNALVITRMLLQTAGPSPAGIDITQSVPFHMEGARIVIEDFTAFPALARGIVQNANIAYLPPDDIQISITAPLAVSVTLHRAPATRRILDRAFLQS